MYELTDAVRKVEFIAEGGVGVCVCVCNLMANETYADDIPEMVCVCVFSLG